MYPALFCVAKINQGLCDPARNENFDLGTFLIFLVLIGKYDLTTGDVCTLEKAQKCEEFLQKAISHFQVA